MASEKTVADAVRMHLTGVHSDSGRQPDPDTSLGNYRATTQVPGLSFRVKNAFSNVRIDFVAGENGEGVGILAAPSASSLRWTPPGGTQGTAVTIASGETKVIEGGTSASKYIRVTRTDSNDLTGTSTVVLTEDFNNVIGFDNVSSAEAAAGDTEYRCVCLKNHGSGSVTNLKVWLGLLGTTASVNATGYSTGAVTITCKETDGLADWPRTGYVENEDTGEVMYYASRTSTALTVAAAGRDIWGETGGGAGVGVSGDEDDVLKPIPGLRLAKEAPNAQPGGYFTDETSNGEGTQPGGLTWEHPHNASDPDVISIGTLTTGQIYGVWLERKVTVGMLASPMLDNCVQWSFTYGGTSYTAEVQGKYRVANAALARYEIYHGTDASPDFDAAPEETFSSLPHETTLTLSADHTHHIVTRYRNEYNMLSANIEEEIIALDSGGEEIEPIPSEPRDILVEAAADGEIRIRANYFYRDDSEDARADEFALWWTTDGSEPNPAGAADATSTMTLVDSYAKLDYTTDADFAYGTTVKVLVRTRRNDGADDYDSDNTTSYSATATFAGPEQPDPAGAFFARIAGQHSFEAWDKWLDEGSGNFVNVAPDGSVEFYISDVLKMKVELSGDITLYDVAIETGQTNLSGTTSASDIDFSGGAWRFFEPAGGTQVMGLSATQLTFDDGIGLTTGLETDLWAAGSADAVDSDATYNYLSVLGVLVARCSATAFETAGAVVQYGEYEE